MKELDLKEKSSKSLLANVLDMDDDFVPSSALPAHNHQQKNGGFVRWDPWVEVRNYDKTAYSSAITMYTTLTYTSG